MWCEVEETMRTFSRIPALIGIGPKELKGRQHDEGTEGRLSPAQKVRRKGVQIVSVKSKFVVPNTVIDWIRASPSAQPLIHVDATFY